VLDPSNLRPMPLGDLFDTAFQIYRKHFWILVAISTLSYLPIRLALVGISQNMLAGGILWNYIVPFGSIIGLYLAVGSAAIATLVNAIWRIYLRQPISVASAFRSGLRRYFALVAASAIPFALGLMANLATSALLDFSLLDGRLPIFDPDNTRMLVVVVLLGLVLVLLIPYARLMVVQMAVLIEGDRPLAALARSWRLTGQARGRAYIVALLTHLLTSLLVVLPWALVNNLLFSWITVEGGLVVAASWLIPLVGEIIALPIQLAVVTLFYSDLRNSAQGFGREPLAQQAARI
jgi:hypothetical protein